MLRNGCNCGICFLRQPSYKAVPKHLVFGMGSALTMFIGWLLSVGQHGFGAVGIMQQQPKVGRGFLTGHVCLNFAKVVFFVGSSMLALLMAKYKLGISDVKNGVVRASRNTLRGASWKWVRKNSNYLAVFAGLLITVGALTTYVYPKWIAPPPPKTSVWPGLPRWAVITMMVTSLPCMYVFNPMQ